MGAQYDGYAAFYVTPDSVTLEAKGIDGEIRHILTVVKS